MLNASVTFNVAPGVDLNGGAELGSATLTFTGSIFGGGAPDIQFSASGIDFLDTFNGVRNVGNLSPLELISVLGDVLNTIDSVTSGQALALEIPFTGTTLGEVLNYADVFKSEVLDPLFKSLDFSTPDSNGDAIIDALDFNFDYTGLQSLLSAIETNLGSPLDANYNSTDNEITFNLDFSRAFGPGDGSVRVIQLDVPGDAGLIDEIQRITITRESEAAFRLTYVDGAGDLQVSGVIDLQDADGNEISDADVRVAIEPS